MKLESDPGVRDKFSRVWQEAFGKTPPLGHILRHEFHSDWTRFHSLPDSKRYAETESERKAILSRANTLVEECFDDKDSIWIVTALYGDFNTEANDVAIKLGMTRTFSWVDPEEEQEDQIQTTFYAAMANQKPLLLDWLFTEIAEDRERAVLFTESDRTVLAPYDGGFDIICRSAEKMQKLETKFESWMSGRPDKL